MQKLRETLSMLNSKLFTSPSKVPAWLRNRPILVLMFAIVVAISAIVEIKTWYSDKSDFLSGVFAAVLVCFGFSIFYTWFTLTFGKR